MNYFENICHVNEAGISKILYQHCDDDLFILKITPDSPLGYTMYFANVEQKLSFIEKCKDSIRRIDLSRLEFTMSSWLLEEV